MKIGPISFDIRHYYISFLFCTVHCVGSINRKLILLYIHYGSDEIYIKWIFFIFNIVYYIPIFITPNQNDRESFGISSSFFLNKDEKPFTKKSLSFLFFLLPTFIDIKYLFMLALYEYLLILKYLNIVRIYV